MASGRIQGGGKFQQGINCVPAVAHDSVGFSLHPEHIFGSYLFDLTLKTESWGMPQEDTGVSGTSLCPPEVSWTLFFLIGEYENIL